MKIAATYDNGNIFQHFGKTEFFKVYEVEDNKVISSEVISSNGTGHGALAGLLADQGISVLICGGIGGGAQAALAEAGVELCSGAQGDVDAAVDAYLKGELVSTGVNCDHHHHEDGHSCGSHEDGHSCGGHEDGHSCGGCGGGCGSQPSITGLTKKEIPVERTAAVAVVEAVEHRALSPDATWVKPAVHITEEPLMTEHSSILPMTVASHWNSSAEPDR